MSEKALPIWTDEQVQTRLDDWNTSIRNGIHPDVVLNMEHSGSDIAGEATCTLSFKVITHPERQVIKLTYPQAILVNDWMHNHRHVIYGGASRDPMLLPAAIRPVVKDSK